MSMTARQYLGLVKRAPQKRDARYHYATVQPLAQSDEEGVEWQGPVTDAKAQFPKRGFLHWHAAPIDVEFGSIWQFVVEEIPKADSEDRPEEFQLVRVVPPIEVIDLRDSDDEAALRSAATSDGLDLAPAPIASRILLWVASGLCVGPLTLKRSAEGQRWTVDAPEGHRDAARMPVRRIPTSRITRIDVNGPRWFLAPGQDLGQSAGIQNWSPDTEVARSILRRLRKMDRQAADALKVIDRVFAEYLDRIEGARLLTVDLAVERARADRLRGVRAAIVGNAELLREAAQTLLDTDDVRKALDREADDYRTQLFESIGGEVEAAFATKREALARIDESIAAGRKRLEQLDEDLRTKAAAFDDEMSKRLREIAKRPEALFAELSIFRAALDATRAIDPVINDPSRSSGPADLVERAVSYERGAPLSTEEGLRTELGRRTVNAGLSPYAALNLHAAFLAGTVPIVLGDRAYDLLRLYAGAMAGGRLNWVPVGGSLMEPHDLLGRFDSSVGRLIPHAAGVLDSIQDATAAARFHIVLLDGFNRAPIDGYLLPILDAAAAARHGDSTRSIPLVNAALLKDDDPYRQMQRAVWPQTALVACIPSYGTATLPIVPEMWRFFTVVDADDRGRPALGAAVGSSKAVDTPPPTEISLELWRSLIPSDRGPTNNAALSALQRLAVEWKLSNGDVGIAFGVYSILRRQAISHEDALGTAVTGSLVPRTSVSAKNVEESLRSLGKVAVGNWRMIYDEADKLRN
jgi:hypothetical protein